MQTPLRDIVAVQARTWSGIEQPNEAAGIMADALAATIAGFEALRGQLAFEDEPSSFEAALQATKEPQP
ncbi:MAG: hypothetical protein Q8S58_14015 [Bosea sp. (in: a-proteobacteria)]|uniref:hypothetical protein n=1 Tax=Bosea sp. (in: a-proteobacteria) TaxID=1871050 RepID=UPI002732AA57|nr:hypothetical protein [Bosea sp. (in: a-proteobacteria)]MDP3254911.1 hypothetical protein [Bosea sp. (in: a-proteobacteria)]MDP3320237.1 hypothetical protein [Bosea sp. (in: a-proteobacteria)]